MTSPERLRRRRCLGLRIATFFAVLLAVYYRGDWAIVGVVSAGGLLALGAQWRDCRGSGAKVARSDTHTRDPER
jgi:hypothetical protein